MQARDKFGRRHLKSPKNKRPKEQISFDKQNKGKRYEMMAPQRRRRKELAVSGLCVLCFLWCFNAVVESGAINADAAVSDGKGRERQSVKKDLKHDDLQPAVVVPTPLEIHHPNPNGAEQKENIITISEKTLSELQSEAGARVKAELDKNQQHAMNADASAGKQPQSEESEESMLGAGTRFTHMQNQIFDIDTDSLRTGSYFFLALSGAAVLYIIIKISRLRLSRAERKYGVQGDRTTQELTPLPIADGNSDEDDHTLFEINHHQTRVL